MWVIQTKIPAAKTRKLYTAVMHWPDSFAVFCLIGHNRIVERRQKKKGKKFQMVYSASGSVGHWLSMRRLLGRVKVTRATETTVALVALTRSWTDLQDPVLALQESRIHGPPPLMFSTNITRQSEGRLRCSQRAAASHLLSVVSC